MKHATITISDDLVEALAAYGRNHGLTDGIDALVEAALRDLLMGHGYLVLDRPFRPFHITPFQHDGEETDVSINHDRYFADGELGGPR